MLIVAMSSCSSSMDSHVFAKNFLLSLARKNIFYFPAEKLAPSARFSTLRANKYGSDPGGQLQKIKNPRDIIMTHKHKNMMIRTSNTSSPLLPNLHQESQ